MDKEIELKGTLAEIIFNNEGNGYTVAVFETEDEQLTIVGNMISPTIGKTYLISGYFKEHPKYGEQFAFKTYEEVLPTTEEGIESFLSSRILKGIGPAMAKAIVSQFGSETLEIIENHPEKLELVPGIGKKKAATITEAFREHRELANVTMFLKQYDIGADFAIKIFEVFGKDAIEEIKNNPYNLIDEIFCISFEKADKIAKKIGIDTCDEFRVENGIKYMLGKYASYGHSYAPRKELVEKTATKILEIPSEVVDDRLVEIGLEGSIKVDVIDNEEVVYLYSYYRAEQNVTKKLVSLCQSPLKSLCLEIDNLIKQTENQMMIQFSAEQKNAMKTCLNNGVSVITGGPGTGKTTIINGILNILACGDFKTAIAAPTGRAAKRMMETTGQEAFTIHRLLEYYYDEDANAMRFGKNEYDQLEYDAIIVDESSMVDLMLMDALLKAIPDGTRLLLVGDADQLPSVGVGNVLRDILESEYIYSERLTQIFRQAQESMIVVNAHRINNGEYPYSNGMDTDFFFMNRKSEREMLRTILELCDTRLPKFYNVEDKTQDIQVITPTRKGMLGSTNLNKELQKVLNPASDFLKEKVIGDRTFRENDKVMQIKNNYQLTWQSSEDFSEGTGVFNGEIGLIRKINNDENKVTVVFDGCRYVDYDFQELEELELAYAMTVHKSQGSEFPVVIMPMTWVPPVLGNRNLLYTGVTRGKRGVVLVGSENCMCAMVDNNSTTKRNSGLAARIKNFM